MKIAGHTMGTPEYTLDEAIELFASQGMDGIEIIWDDEYKCALRKSSAGSELKELADRLAGKGLELCCLTPYMSDIDSLDEKTRRRDLDDFSRCIQAAAALGAPSIRVYGGAYHPDQDSSKREQLEEKLVLSLSEMGDAAAGHGVTLVVETHFNTLTCTAEETARLVRQVGHPRVRVLYDQPNLEFSGGEKHPRALQLLEGFIAMVHVKDLVYKENATGGFTSSKVYTVDESVRQIYSRVPGQGIIPWPEILPVLAAQGYDGWLSLEYERRWFPQDLPPAEQGMKQGLEYIRGLLEKL
jgi:sugar phosphate isomerase/epimerase